jgi:flagellar basal-body rod modification protein FlgD
MTIVSATDYLTPSAAPPAPAASARGMDELGSQEFLKLMLTELTNQDPLEPTDNETLLRQISSIRDIELSTSLTDSIRQLAGHQQIGSASTLIGQFVTSRPGEDGSVAGGVVVGVTFGEGGRPVLQLSSGAQLPLEQVAAVEPAQQAAERLIGAAIVGLDRRVADDPKLVEGVVTGVRQSNSGEVLLELDTGANLRLRDLISVVADEIME